MQKGEKGEICGFDCNGTHNKLILIVCVYAINTLLAHTNTHRVFYQHKESEINISVLQSRCDKFVYFCNNLLNLYTNTHTHTHTLSFILCVISLPHNLKEHISLVGPPLNTRTHTHAHTPILVKK